MLGVMPIIRRVMQDPDGSEEIWTPHKDANDQFVMATKKTSQPLNHLSNQVKVTLMIDVIAKLRSGKYSLRMVNGRGAANLISSKSIEIIE